MSEDSIPHEDVIYDSAIVTLRYGFIVSAALLVAGIVWSITARHPLSSEVLPFADLPGALLDGDPTALIDIGILAMMFTPVAAVLAIAWNFARLGERKFVWLTLGTLAILVASIMIALLR